MDPVFWDTFDGPTTAVYAERDARIARSRAARLLQESSEVCSLRARNDVGLSAALRVFTDSFGRVGIEYDSQVGVLHESLQV